MIPNQEKLADIPKVIRGQRGRQGLSRHLDVPPCTSAQVRPVLGLSLNTSKPCSELCVAAASTRTPAASLRSVGSKQCRQTHVGQMKNSSPRFVAAEPDLLRVTKDSCKKHEKLSKGRVAGGSLRSSTCKINRPLPVPLHGRCWEHSKDATFI